MRIYVAGDCDTLRTIAAKYKVDLAAITILNPLVTDADYHLSGALVNIPDEPDPAQIAKQYPLTPPREEYSEHWIPVTPVEQMAQTDYDVLIIGSGAGGGAVAWRLSEQWKGNGNKIGIVEAGDLLLPTNVLNIPTSNIDEVDRVWMNPKYSTRILEACPSHGGRPVPVEYTISHVLGGKTLHWGAAAPRMDRADLVQWPVTYEEMTQYYNIAEQVMSVTPFFAAGSAFQEVMLGRLRENGYPFVTACPRAVDLQPTRYDQIHSNVFFSSIIFLALAMNRLPVDLAVKSRVVQVLHEKGQAVGVHVMTRDKKSYVLKAKKVVLSAGTLESPRILLNSGIEGNAIGHYLANHSRVSAGGTVARADFPENLGILDLLIPRTEARPFLIQVLSLQIHQYKEIPVREDLGVGLDTNGLVESRYENRITLDPVRKDEYGMPKLQIHFSYSDKDWALIGRMGEALKQAASAMKVSLNEKNGRPDITLRRPGGENHESGTCRMGIDPATSATDRFGQVHGISGLYVADNSVHPTTGAAHPTLTTVALAIRTADHIVSQT